MMIKKTLFRAKQLASRSNLFKDLNKSSLPVKSSPSENVDYLEKDSKHRPIYSIYDLIPSTDLSFIAPNATIVGEVHVSPLASVGYNSVIRGDINSVKIGDLSVIGDHTVIYTANSLPTGLPASVEIGENNIIQNRVTLYSCHTEKNVFIGHGTVVLEGSRIEQGSVVLPNSVVPPGRIIPAHQIWGGNPVRFVRNIRPGEVFSNYANTYQFWQISKMHLETFTPYNYSYLEREASKEDVDLAPENIFHSDMFDEPDKKKHYLL